MKELQSTTSLTEYDSTHHDQFNLIRIGILLGQDNHDLNARDFEDLTSKDKNCVADYINAKYGINVKRGDDTYRILVELDEKIQARTLPSLPTE